MWSVELVGGVNDPGFAEGDRSLDFIPQDWTPGEGPYDSVDEMGERVHWDGRGRFSWYIGE